MLRIAPELRYLVTEMPGGQFAAVSAEAMPSARQQRIDSARRDGFATDERVLVEDRCIRASTADVSIPLRIYRPRVSIERAAALLYFHGGAFCRGTLDTEHGRTLRIAAELQIVVISVEYRLAPEHPFPAGVEDCYDALQWVSSAATELRIDASRIAVGGQSAGGCLAAAVALMTRDRRGPPLAFQFLVYPLLDDRLTSASMTKFVATPVFNRADAEHAWSLYLGALRRHAPPYAAPARSSDVHGLPDVYIMTAQYDPVRDEGIEFGARLLRAGVSVELHNVAGAVHGFDLLGTGPLADFAIATQLDALRRGLSTPR